MPQSVLGKLSNKLSALTTTFDLRRPHREVHHLVSIRHVDVPLVVHRRFAGGDEAFMRPFPLSHKLTGGRELLDPIVAESTTKTLPLLKCKAEAHSESKPEFLRAKLMRRLKDPDCSPVRDADQHGQQRDSRDRYAHGESLAVAEHLIVGHPANHSEHFVLPRQHPRQHQH